jgi:hypothetical protein
MIRSMSVGAAGLLWFAATATAQPISVLRSQTLGDWQTARLVSTAPAQAEGAGAASSNPPPADSFEALQLRSIVGETVYVVDAAGRETRGRVTTLSDVALTVTIDETRRELAAADIRRIDRRRRDSVRNGLLIGGAAGALMGFAVGRSADSPSCPRSGLECGQGAMLGTVGGALWGAVGGWITDALIRKREIIYAARGPR